MFFLDISHAISAYDNATARTAFQHVSEPLLNAFEVDVAGDLKSMAGAAEELNSTIKNIVDGVVYGLLTAGVFAWLWP